ncbi:MAG: peroxide stress protein YaaA [Rickettsiales bacterium]|nr:peroxide stress protein YaaA [Rickettsiales bacterium]
MLTLLSPAKSLNLESSISHPDFTLPHFAKEANQLASELKKLAASDLEKLMKISKNLAELNHQRFQNFSNKFTLQNSKQALLAFDGDVYKPIEVAKFSDADFAFAQKHLRILSGFYGLLKPLDLMQPYRLEMGTAFDKNFFTKNLYQFWGDKISQQLDLERPEHIINLASEEYFAAVNHKKISTKIINITFKENKNGTYKIVGIHAKKARGLMANFIVKNKISKPEDLKKFDLEKYSFKQELSSESNFVFVR